MHDSGMPRSLSRIAFVSSSLSNVPSGRHGILSPKYCVPVPYRTKTAKSSSGSSVSGAAIFTLLLFTTIWLSRSQLTIRRRGRLTVGFWGDVSVRKAMLDGGASGGGACGVGFVGGCF